jgi:hypothetical protein
MQDIGHFVRVVLVHLAAIGFDKDFFAHGGSKRIISYINNSYQRLLHKG